METLLLNELLALKPIRTVRGPRCAKLLLEHDVVDPVTGRLKCPLREALRRIFGQMPTHDNNSKIRQALVEAELLMEVGPDVYILPPTGAGTRRHILTTASALLALAQQQLPDPASARRALECAFSAAKSL